MYNISIKDLLDRENELEQSLKELLFFKMAVGRKSFNFTEYI